MARMTLNKKLGSTLVAMWVGLLLLVILGAWQTRSALITDRQVQLRAAVDAGMSFVQHYHDLETQHVLTPQEAQKQAAAAIGTIRFGGDGYISINNYQAVMVMHPIKPELNGKDLSSFRDESGVAVFSSLASLGRENSHEGFLSYVWPKPGSSKSVEKLSFVKGFSDWNWCLVTGMYMDDVNATFQGILIRWVGMGLGLALVITLIMLVIVRSIRRTMGGALEEAISTAHRIAEGDLTGRLNVVAGDESSLMASLAQMQTSLVRTVTQVRQGTDAIHTGTREIASGNQDLSQRTEEQAAALEETAASMEELSATVGHNAANAQEASGLAKAASATAENGGKAVDLLLQSMGHISESSKQIGDILSVIDGIAFQTNILALNAAVEAARAGEAGRGFAVVASEVRNLAQRSMNAAKDIKALIVTSSQHVQEGSKAVDGARATMTDIVTAVNRVNGIMGEIAEASVEQRRGIEQVATAVGQMDTVTQQNAALVEEAAAAASSLEEQAHRLTEAVAFLRVD